MTWISLYNLCRHSSRERNKFQMVFSLSALAYSSHAIRCLIPTILAFAIIPQFRNLHPPSWLSYDLSRGFHPDSDELSRIVHQSALLFEDSPESRLSRHDGEIDAAVSMRRFSTFKSHIDSQVHELVAHFTAQWPCEKPDSPSSPTDGYVVSIFGLT